MKISLFFPIAALVVSVCQANSLYSWTQKYAEQTDFNLFDWIYKWIPSSLKPKKDEVSDESSQVKDEYRMEFRDIVEKYGYQFNNYQLTTEDGYILNMFRVRASNETKPPVILQHGLIDSADAWIMNGRSQSPAFMLVEAGFDVWLPNSRGSRFSRMHTSLNADSSDKQLRKQYWEFSFTEMAKYDAKSIIDKVIEQTGFSKVSWLGHSQGASIILFALSEPKLQKLLSNKINAIVGLAPLAYLDNVESSFFKTISDLRPTIDWVSDLFGIYEVLGEFNLELSKIGCGFVPIICSLEIELVDSDTTQFDNQKRLQVYVGGHLPAGGSLMNLEHWEQIYQSKLFKQFDYGPEQNQIKYNQEEAPLINLKNVQQSGVPILLIAASHDSISSHEDVKRLASDIKAKYDLIDGGHQTFMVGKDMNYISHLVIPMLNK